MRNIKIINDSWLFTDKASAVESIPADAVELNLPYTWNGKDGQDGGNDYKRLKAFYYKEIPSTELTGEENFLEFDAVNSSAEIFWNGKSIFTHHGGYSRFRVKIPANDVKETNLLTVTADNSPNETVYPQTADFTFYGGIYRSVKLISVPSAHFDLEYFGAPGIMVTPEIKGDNADVKVRAYTKNAEDAALKFTILDGEAVVCGMYFILDWAYSQNYITYSYYRLSIDLLSKYGFKPLKLQKKSGLELVSLMKKDKKNSP